MVSIAIVTNHTRRGFTLVELLVAIAVGSLALTATMSLSLYSLRSFAALTNYVDLDNLSRNALDHMTREIRQADRVLPGSDGDTLRLWVTPYGAAGREVVFEYDAQTGNVTRTEGSDVEDPAPRMFQLLVQLFSKEGRRTGKRFPRPAWTPASRFGSFGNVPGRSWAASEYGECTVGQSRDSEALRFGIEQNRKTPMKINLIRNPTGRAAR
jgi:prepilin-type N-terminal cleavage/methylation domain-containing protein